LWDVALGKAMAEDTVTDEVLPEIKRRRTPWHSGFSRLA
jgi:hypothetical protein